MPDTLQLATRLLALLALLAALSGPARAQDDDFDDDDPAPMNPREAALLQIQAQQRFMANDQNFEVGVFGNLRSAEAAHSQLDKLLTLQTDEVDRLCGLTRAQKKKLELAARGDVKRFFDRVDEKRKVFQLVKNDQAGFQKLYQELSPLQNALRQGFFEEPSLFFKTLKTVLDAEQFARYEKALRDRRVYRFQTRIDRVVTSLDNAAGLDSGQRQRLRKLIQDEVRPPKTFSQYDQYVILYQLAMLPEARLKAIFNEDQWPLIGHQFERARAMEMIFMKNDYLPEGWKAR